MSRACVTLLFAVSVAAQGCISATSSWMKDSAPTGPPGPDQAKVVFFRPPAYQKHLFEYRIWDGGTLAGISENGGYFEYLCRPGEHVFVFGASPGPAVLADLAGGRTYYVRIQVGGITRMIPVTRDAAEERKLLSESFGRCGARTLRPDRATEERLAKYRPKVLEKMEEFKGPRAAECGRLTPEDGH